MFCVRNQDRLKRKNVVDNVIHNAICHQPRRFYDDRYEFDNRTFGSARRSEIRSFRNYNYNFDDGSRYNADPRYRELRSGANSIKNLVDQVQLPVL